MLLPHPAPYAVPHVPVQAAEDVFRAGAIAIEVRPATQDGVEFLEQVVKRPVQGLPRRQLLDLVPQVRRRRLRHLDAGRPAEAVVPSHAHAMSEELEAVGRISDPRLVGGQGQPHAIAQCLGESVPLGLGLLLRAVHQDHEVVGISHREHHHSTGTPVRAACFQCRLQAIALPVCPPLGSVLHPPLVSLFDQTQGDIVQQWRDDAPLRRAGIRAKELLFAKDTSLQELHEQSVHPQVSTVLAHALHKQMMVDVVEGTPDTLPISKTFRRQCVSCAEVMPLKGMTSRCSGAGSVQASGNR